jgi:hypothetical protein
MLKTLLIVAVLFTSASTTPHDPSKKNDGANLPQNNGSNEGSPSISVVNNETPYPNKETTQTEPPHWYTSAEWWLFILGIPTLFVVGRQAVLMAEHAEHLKGLAEAAADNAKAAKLSAQAVIDAERPWLVVQFAQTNNLDSGAMPMFDITCLNQGKTPALIKRLDGGHKIVRNPSETLELPIPMEGLRPLRLPDLVFIVNRDSFKVWPGIKPEDILTAENKRPEINMATEFLVFFGRVEYDDVFDSGDESKEPHVTSWCYIYDPSKSALQSSGPKGYQEYT